MAKIVKEELWWPCDMVVVTTCGVLRRDHSLVMRAGAAKQAAERYPDLPEIAGNYIYTSMRRVDWLLYEYGFIPDLNVVKHDDGIKGVGIFQTKYKFTEKSLPSLILSSVGKMNLYAMLYKDANIRMNYPGIGRGGLSMEIVAPLLKALPDNVTICYQDVRQE